MDIFKRLFAKSLTTSLFSVVFPQAPAGLQNPEYLKAYKGWVYACVKRKADSIATVEFTLQRKQGGEWKEVSSGPQLRALDLLTTVNQFLTSDALYRGTSSYLDLVGNSFWYVAYNGKQQPSELWQLDPTKMDVVKDDRNYISHWVYTNPKGRKIKLSIFEVIPFQEFNPLDPYKGMGPTEAGAIKIDSDRYRAEWSRNFFANSAIPGLVLKTKQNLNQEQYDRLMTGWISRFQGIRNAHKPAVLEGDMDVKELNSTLKDMDLTGQNREDRDQILAIFGVPKVLLGISETGDSRSDAEGAEYVFSRYTLAPRMRFMATTLTEFYLPLWGMSPNEYRLYAADCVPRNAEMDLKRTESSLTHGYATINEVRAQEGKKPVEGGDTVFVPSTWTPIDLAINPPDPMPMGGQGGDGKPAKPTKAITKDAYDESIGLRITFLHKAIKTGQKDMQEIFAAMAADATTRLFKVKSAKTKKDDDPNATLVTESALITAVLADWDTYIAALIAYVLSVTRPVYGFGGTRSMANSGLSIAFDLANPRAEQWLRERGLRSATQISETVKDEIRTRLVQGVKDGKGVKEIAASLSEFFDDESQWRALRIARSEVIEAYSQGSLEGARQGNLTEKRWLTAGDDRVEEECLRNEVAGWIPRETAFPTGHVAPVIHPNDRCDVEYRAAA